MWLDCVHEERVHFVCIIPKSDYTNVDEEKLIKLTIEK